MMRYLDSPRDESQQLEPGIRGHTPASHYVTDIQFKSKSYLAIDMSHDGGPKRQAQALSNCWDMGKRESRPRARVQVSNQPPVFQGPSLVSRQSRHPPQTLY
jgi:hypothetical protein